jgi:hypothetical protein
MKLSVLNAAGLDLNNVLAVKILTHAMMDAMGKAGSKANYERNMASTQFLRGHNLINYLL